MQTLSPYWQENMPTFHVENDNVELTIRRPIAGNTPFLDLILTISEKWLLTSIHRICTIGFEIQIQNPIDQVRNARSANSRVEYKMGWRNGKNEEFRDSS